MQVNIFLLKCSALSLQKETRGTLTNPVTTGEIATRLEYLAGAQRPESDWQVVSLLILQAWASPIHCDWSSTREAWSGGFYLDSPWEILAAYWVSFSPASLVGEFGVGT